MSTTNIAFSGGVDAVPPYGQKTAVQFGGTWAVGETWTLAFAYSGSNFTVGLGYWDGVPTCCLTFKNRVYVGMGDRFCFSKNGDCTLWEEQDDGAGYQEFLSQIGGQDSIKALAQLQGRLAVFGRRSIQMWTVDADPSSFAMGQPLENIGTNVPKSVHNVGDYDVLFLADSGLRSLRSREITQNATIDDIGSPIDPLVQDEMLHSPGSGCAVVNPGDGRYWIFINDEIYVFSNHPSAKVQAWATYLPADHLGADFAPQWLVIYNGIVYCRSVGRTLLIYGASDGLLYDGSVVKAETPWLENRSPMTAKQSQGIQGIFSGPWTIALGMDPRSAKLENVLVRGDENNPNDREDSSLGTGVIPVMLNGSHYKFKFTSSPNCQRKEVFTAILFKDQRGNLV